MKILLFEAKIFFIKSEISPSILQLCISLLTTRQTQDEAWMSV